MADELKLDSPHSPANSLTRHLLRGSASNGTREGHYYNEDAAVSLTDAIDSFIAEAAGAYPGTAIPFSSVSAYRLAPNVIRLLGRYAYGPGGALTSTADELSRSDAGYITFKTWHKSTSFDSKGRPNGDLNFDYTNSAIAALTTEQKKLIRPRPTFIQMPFHIIRIQTVLSPSGSPLTSPVAGVVPHLGKLNADDVKFAGVQYHAREVQFQRILVDTVQENEGVKYHIEYTLGFRRSMWVVELEPQWNGSAWVEDADGAFSAGGTPGNPWYAAISDTVNFTGLFPIHA
jgi:hypothetical protein